MESTEKGEKKSENTKVITDEYFPGNEGHKHSYCKGRLSI